MSRLFKTGKFKALRVLIAAGLLIPAMPFAAIAEDEVEPMPVMGGISGSVETSSTMDSAEATAVADAMVTVWTAEAMPSVAATTTTDVEGFYEVDVPLGDYFVQFEKEGFGTQFYNLAAELSEAETVTVTADDVSFTRLGGEDRYDTALEISEYAYPAGLSDESTKTVVIARGERFPDALAGSAIAGLVDGPILLTRSGRLLDEVAAEIERLGAEQVVLLGEELALSAEVEAAVAEIVGEDNVMRFGGETRYDTAAAIAEYVIDELGEEFGGAAFVGTGAKFPDSLAASPMIGAQGMPLFLAHPASGLSSATVDAMTGVESAVVLGGELAVSSEVATDLADFLGGSEKVERVGGGDRYETAAMVAEYGVGLGHTWNKVGIATGVRFPDSLTGGALQAKSGSVVLLTRAASLTEFTADALEEHASHICEGRIFGGELAITADVEAEIEAIFPGCGKVTTGVDAMLVPVPVVIPEPSGISGMVTEAPVDEPVAADAHGIEGAMVSVWTTDASSKVATTTTDADGDYSVEVEPGDYIVQFEAEGYYGQFFDGVADLSEATTVTVEAEMFTEGVDAMLDMIVIIPEPSGISGMVTEAPVDEPVAADAHGIEGAMVTVWPIDAMSEVATTTTDADGFYSVEVEPGGYIVEFEAEGYHGQFFDGVEDIAVATTVNVEAEMFTEGVDAMLDMIIVDPEPSGISGMVTEEILNGPVVADAHGIEGAMVTVWTSDEMPVVVTTATTDETGSFSVEVEPGEYYVQFEADGYVSQFFDGVEDLAEATPVTVEAEMFTGNVNAALVPVINDARILK